MRVQVHHQKGQSVNKSIYKSVLESLNYFREHVKTDSIESIVCLSVFSSRPASVGWKRTAKGGTRTNVGQVFTLISTHQPQFSSMCTVGNKSSTTPKFQLQAILPLQYIYRNLSKL